MPVPPENLLRAFKQATHRGVVRSGRAARLPEASPHRSVRTEVPGGLLPDPLDLGFVDIDLVWLWFANPHQGLSLSGLRARRDGPAREGTSE